jgi:hypothetical protein
MENRWLGPVFVAGAVLSACPLSGDAGGADAGPVVRVQALPSPGFPIYRLAFDDRGELVTLVGTDLDVGVLDRASGQWNAVAAPPGTNQLMAGADGTVWFSAASGMATYRGGVVAEVPPVGCTEPALLAIDPRGGAWVRCPAPQTFAHFDPDTRSWTRWPVSLELDAFVVVAPLSDGRLLLSGEARRAAVLEFTEAGPVERMLSVGCAPGALCLGCDVPGLLGGLGPLHVPGQRDTLLSDGRGYLGRLAEGALEYEALARSSPPDDQILFVTGQVVDGAGRHWLGLRHGSNRPTDTGRVYTLTPSSKLWRLAFEHESIQSPQVIASPAREGVVVFDQNGIVEVLP